MNKKERDQESIAKKDQFYFLKGREYERMYEKKLFTRKGIIEAGNKIRKQFPKYKKPDDGNGEDDAFNAGYNKAIDDIAKLFIDSFAALSEDTTTEAADLHDFERTKKYANDGIFFIGEEYRCKNCSFTHLCTLEKAMGPSCIHLDSFYHGCLKNKDTVI